MRSATATLLSLLLTFAACLTGCSAPQNMCAYNVPPSPADPHGLSVPPVYGLYCWAGNYVTYADDIEKVGIKWIRAGGWRYREQADAAALLAARKGVTLIPVLDIEGLGHGKSMPLDEAVTRYRAAVRDAVQRYGVGGTLWKEHPDNPYRPIRFWQIWNEPNIEFLDPGDSGLLRTEFYAALLKAAGEEIRRLDYRAVIIAFNTAGGRPHLGSGLDPDGMYQRLKYIGWRKFIRDVIQLAGPDSYHAIGTHPYVMPMGPEEGRIVEGVEMIRQMEKELGVQERSIWFTEVGWPLEYPNNKQVRDERQQACYTVRLYALAAAHGVTQVQNMHVEDIIYGPDGSRRSFGFFIEPGQWREQATATQTMIRLIPDPRDEAKELSAEPGGVYAMQFKGSKGKPVIMAWHAGEGTVEHVFDLGGGAIVINMLGEELAAPAVAAGKVKVQLSEAPIYLLPRDDQPPPEPRTE